MRRAILFFSEVEVKAALDALTTAQEDVKAAKAKVLAAEAKLESEKKNADKANEKLQTVLQ